jgi:hypothetical protein
MDQLEQSIQDSIARQPATAGYGRKIKRSLAASTFSLDDTTKPDTAPDPFKPIDTSRTYRARRGGRRNRRKGSRRR